MHLKTCKAWHPQLRTHTGIIEGTSMIITVTCATVSGGFNKNEEWKQEVQKWSWSYMLAILFLIVISLLWELLLAITILVAFQLFFFPFLYFTFLETPCLQKGPTNWWRLKDTKPKCKVLEFWMNSFKVGFWSTIFVGQFYNTTTRRFLQQEMPMARYHHHHKRSCFYFRKKNPSLISRF